MTCDEQKIAAAYTQRTKPVAAGWLASDNPAVRLVGADAFFRAGDARAWPRLIDALDDPHLVNRQFAYKGLQEVLIPRPADVGYRFWMTPAERRAPLAELRA